MHTTRTAIDSNLTLDGESSSLARLRRELLTILEKHTETNSTFQEEVKVALGKMVAQREESQRSTQHGLVFEDAVCQYLEYHAQQCGDIATRTGHTTGLIKNCKKGDCLVELGPDTAAPQAKIAVEAKEDASFTLPRTGWKSRKPARTATRRLGCSFFPSATVPQGIEEIFRFGNDVFVVWDFDDASTNLHLKVAHTLARTVHPGRTIEPVAGRRLRSDYEGHSGNRKAVAVSRRSHDLGRIDQERGRLGARASSKDAKLTGTASGDPANKDRRSRSARPGPARQLADEHVVFLGQRVVSALGICDP